ncbi:MAG TPA: hypothetical protein VIP70_04725 [Nitrososphaeraceae archaeon]
MQYIFLSHDVDWRREGAPVQHIMDRKKRFDKATLDQLTTKNPYYNIPDYMSIEEKFGVRSTFFFRTIYEDGNFTDYEDDIKSLINGGWEVGLHSDPASVNSIDKIHIEKMKLESLAKAPIKANRVHYLNFDPGLPIILQALQFVYDSSWKKSKGRVVANDMGYYKIGDLIEFPITFMDAYLFTYMKVKEYQIIPILRRTLNKSSRLHNKIITVIWHDNALKMKKGRMYRSILEYLSAQEDVTICRGIDLAKMIKTGGCIKSP